MRNLIFIMLLAIYGSISFADDANYKIIVLSDYDFTVTSHLANTEVVLYRRLQHLDVPAAQAIQHTLKKINLAEDDLPHEIRVTQVEYEEIEKYLDKSDYSTTLFIPSLEKRIIPSVYHFSHLSSFSGYYDNKQLLKDYEEAKKKANSFAEQEKFFKSNNLTTEEALFNYGFFTLKHLLKDENADIFIHTARSQSPEAFKKLFETIKADGFLPKDSNIEKIKFHPLGRLDAAGYTAGSKFKGIGERKMNFLKEGIASIIAAGDADVNVLFMEDNFRYFSEAYRVMLESSKLRHIKDNTYFHLVYTGSPKDFQKLKDTLYSEITDRAITISPGGVVKPMKEKTKKLLGIHPQMNKIIEVINEEARKDIKRSEVLLECFTAIKGNK